MKKHKILGFSEDFVLILAPAGGFEPLAYRLGEAAVRLRRLLTKPRQTLPKLTFF